MELQHSKFQLHLLCAIFMEGKQNIERQIRSIQVSYPEAVIVKETYSGTKFQGRRGLEKILAKVEPGSSLIP